MVYDLQAIVVFRNGLLMLIFTVPPPHLLSFESYRTYRVENNIVTFLRSSSSYNNAPCMDGDKETNVIAVQHNNHISPIKDIPSSTLYYNDLLNFITVIT